MADGAHYGEYSGGPGRTEPMHKMDCTDPADARLLKLGPTELLAAFGWDAQTELKLEHRGAGYLLLLKRSIDDMWTGCVHVGDDEIGRCASRSVHTIGRIDRDNFVREAGRGFLLRGRSLPDPDDLAFETVASPRRVAEGAMVIRTHPLTATEVLRAVLELNRRAREAPTPP